jgi:hypothetical protein
LSVVGKGFGLDSSASENSGPTDDEGTDDNEDDNDADEEADEVDAAEGAVDDVDEEGNDEIMDCPNGWFSRGASLSYIF